MKTKLTHWIRSVWMIIADVPGWPDAPVRVRLQRAAPILLPCFGIIALLVWSFGVQVPRARSEAMALGPLVELEEEISTLQVACSAEEVREAADRAAVVSRLLFASAEELPAFLKSLKKQAYDRGWDASFSTSDGFSDTSPAEALISYATVRGKLAPSASIAEPFPSFLALLESFSSAGKRIDLMRLTIRADDQRWHGIELTLRLAMPVPHEKTP